MRCNSRIILLSVFVCSISVVLLGCTKVVKEVDETLYFEPAKTRGKKHLTSLPLSDKWTEVKLLDYSYGRFSFPPPAGYRILHYVDYLDKGVVDLHREVINETENLLGIIKQRKGSDHCDLYGENISNIQGMDLIEVKGDCYIWHQGDFKRKYYFLRVGPIVYTFRMFSDLSHYEENQYEFDLAVNYLINNYLLYPVERAEIEYEYIAHPISQDELISFFRPAVLYLQQSKK